jgi:hypothetical protein
MLQRYKVRLGDGTVLTVDEDGLRTLLADAGATVQAPGTQVWRPLQEFLAEEESAARLARALVPPEPRRSPAPSPPEDLPPSPVVELSIGKPPMVQALADEPAASGTPAAPWHDSPDAADEAPPLRLKPLDDEPRAPRALPRARMEDDDVDEEDRAQRYDRLDGPLLQVLSTFGALLSRCLEPLTPLVRRWSSTSADGRAPRRAASVPPGPPRRPPSAAPSPQVRVLAEDPGGRHARPRPGVAELPVIPLKPTDDEGGLEATTLRRFSDRILGWLAVPIEWVRRLVAGGRPEPRVTPTEAAPKKPQARRTPGPAPREPLAAPVPIKDLPVLRFADAHETTEAEDVYEGEEASSPFPTLWLWTKRIVLVGGVVTGGVLVALNWQAWFPRAAELGQRVFTEVDRQARSSRRTEEQQQALREATERLPHLAPETIRLVLSASDSRTLDPPEVFQLASEAADRGLQALTPAEAAELRALQHELLGHLRPPERARVDEYDRARSRRVVFSFENPHVLELVARGARAMPPRSLERLRTLLGKAVAAGLGIPAASPGVGPAAEP